MPSAKRRLSQLQRENSKISKNNKSIFSFVTRNTDEPRSTEGTSRGLQQPDDLPVPDSDPDHRDQTCVPEPVSTKLYTPAKDHTVTNKGKNGAGHKVGFDRAWQINRTWLISKLEVGHDGEMSEVMYCTLCQEHGSWGHNGSKAWVEKGCRTLRLDKVKEHEVSAQHKQSITISLESTLENMTEKIHTESEKAIYDALKVLYFIITKNLPLDIFGDMIDMCISVGSKSLQNLRLAKNASYTSWDITNELLQILSNHVRSEVKSEMKDSPCYSIMVDEVCDLTTTKHVALCSRYVGANGETKTSFLSDAEIKSATADGLVSSICTQVQENDLDLHNMSGFASDGAAVFTGKRNGVAKQLRDINPKMVTTHCKDHRLALACRDSFGNEPAFKKLDKTLDALYGNYNFSSNKKASLRDVQKAFDEAPLSIKQAKHHRWLSHEKAVNSIVRSYKCIITDLESSSISSDPQGHGILKTLKKPDTVRNLLLLADVLPHVTALSLFFQQRDCHVGEVSGQVDKALKKIRKLKSSDGPWLNKADSVMQESGITFEPPSSEFKNGRTNFLESLEANIIDRFSDTDVMDNLSVLDLSKNDDLPSFYGQYEMECLANHYQMDAETLLVQWQEFIDIVKIRAANMRTLPELLKLFYSPDHQQKGLAAQFPLVADLVAAACVMPLSTAEVERVFSAFKLVKTAHRCSLKTVNVDRLLNIKLNCADSMFERLRPVVVKHFFEKDRRLTSAIKAASKM